MGSWCRSLHPQARCVQLQHPARACPRWGQERGGRCLDPHWTKPLVLRSVLLIERMGGCSALTWTASLWRRSSLRNSDPGSLALLTRKPKVQCFLNLGHYGTAIFPGGQLHAVSGPEFSLNPWVKKPTGYIVNMATGELTGTWNVPGGLQNPHDVAVSEDGNTVYVCELNPFKVWKLTTGGSREASTISPPGLMDVLLGILG